MYAHMRMLRWNHNYTVLRYAYPFNIYSLLKLQAHNQCCLVLFNIEIAIKQITRKNSRYYFLIIKHWNNLRWIKHIYIHILMYVDPWKFSENDTARFSLIAIKLVFLYHIKTLIVAHLFINHSRIWLIWMLLPGW